MPLSPSNTSTRSARFPQQERSARRKSSILAAAEELIVVHGYETVTMTGIAKRARASIGALYDYFPDKPSIAYAILNIYAQEIEDHWEPLVREAATLTPRRFAERFIQHMLDFIAERPAFLPLVNAPIQFARDPEARRATRRAFADAFRAIDSSLSADAAYVTANIALQMISAMTALFKGVQQKERDLIAAEFKRMLALYLSDVLKFRGVAKVQKRKR